ncbi:hypothetical protein NARC_100090 [Candidatus Nitrosocosmicus arcticus]|uniref:Uncharacterized protein n=1 Tax=Candidatus Nitrosocosmicus arcticus TaxID=2035267 RepID=A0A557STW4_9ARCH|nr:hypothetical protein NARC_100090 [Candidatus Nitrosocosmicus arcticus]
MALLLLAMSIDGGLYSTLNHIPTGPNLVTNQIINCSWNV